MINTTALGPVPLHAGSDQVLVTRHEEKVVIDKLLAVGLLHAEQGVVLAGQVALELLEGALHEVLHVQPLLLGDSRRQSKTIDAPSNADTGGLDRGVRVDIAIDLGGIHVGSMLEVLSQSMVFSDDGIEDIGKVDIRISITSVDTTMLVIKLNSASDGLQK